MRIMLLPLIPLNTPPNKSPSPSNSAKNLPTHAENEFVYSAWPCLNPCDERLSSPTTLKLTTSRPMLPD